MRFYPPHVVSPALEQVVRRALAVRSAARWPTVDALKAELVRLSGDDTDSRRRDDRRRHGARA